MILHLQEVEAEVRAWHRRWVSCSGLGEEVAKEVSFEV